MAYDIKLYPLAGRVLKILRYAIALNGEWGVGNRRFDASFRLGIGRINKMKDYK